MKTLKFKTNIKCSGCIANVTPFLNSIQNIKKWNVDIDNPEKTLTIEGENIAEKDVISLVESAGYTIAPKN
ncbi:MAG: heavy-metal-associated domain-containing protein [Bacteroidia bacterium]